MDTPPDTPSISRRLQHLFLSGLLTLLPIWLTWIVVKFVFTLLSDLSKPLIGPLSVRIASGFPKTMGWIHADAVQGSIGLIATLVLILMIGWLARRVLGQRVLGGLEALMLRIPLAGTVYSSARKLLDILQKKPDGTQRVVLINFPNEHMKAVGLVTRVIHEHGSGRELAAVYVPTTPNPTSGYLEIVPVDQITPTDWTVDQAMSFIISGGAAAPDSISFAPAAQTPAERKPSEAAAH